MALMSFAEYARHRGVSKVAVTYAVRDGRISTTTDGNGKPCVESDIADKEWDKNTAHQLRRNTEDTKNGAATGPAPLASKRVEPADYEPSKKTWNDDEEPETDNETEADNTYSKARARKEHYNAELAELKFKEECGKLVDADEVRERWTEIATLLRNRVLSIPSKCKQKMPELNDEQYLAIEEIVREQLAELSSHGDD